MASCFVGNDASLRIWFLHVGSLDSHCTKSSLEMHPKKSVEIMWGFVGAFEDVLAPFDGMKSFYSIWKR